MKNNSNLNLESLEEVIKLSYLESKNLDNFEKTFLFEKKYLKGKNSCFSLFLSKLKDVTDKEEKARIGKFINEWKEKLFESVENNKKKLFIFNNKGGNKDNLVSKKSLLGKKAEIGSFHLVRKSLSEIYFFFASLGYKVFESKEIDTEWYNFDSLNLEKNHPARNSSDTFYLSGKPEVLLRTHTSNSQVRVMEKNKNCEIMVVSGGKVYRNDDDDLTHSHQYTNIELVRVDKKASFANLKWTLERFFQWFFEREIKTRFRPSFFPFTEPSFEVDISCSSCKGNSQKDCKVCKNTGWIEVLGAGLINPVVLKNAGYDEKKFSGFAAGIGLERILMIKYGIDDIRNFYSNDPRFLIQTGWN